MESDIGSNEDEAFEAHLAPIREALIGLLDASDQLRDAWGSMPAADSHAMAELAAEGRFKGTPPWDDEPVAAAHNLAQLLLFGASDCARALVRVLTSETTPVYAHTVLARASLELASRAWWLLEPTIGVRLRVARGVNERLFSLSEQARLPIEDADRERARERRAALLDEAARLGFRKNRSRPRTPPSLEEERPRQTALARKLLEVGDDAALGGLVYGAFSAVAHGTTFGLSSSITLDAPNLPRTPGVTWGAVYTSSREVVSVLTAVVLGIGEAYSRRNTLFGWSSDTWSQAWLHALRTARNSLPTE